MKLLIAVPSKARPDLFKERTYAMLTEYAEHDWLVFVEPQDYDAYVTAGIDRKHIYELEANNKGLGYAKDTIQRFALEHEYDYVFKMDDDVKGFGYGTAHKIDPSNLPSLLRTVDKLVTKEPKIDAIRLSGNFDVAFDKTSVSKAFRVSCNYFIKPELLTGGKYTAIEDEYQSLILLRDGRNILRVAFTQDMTEIGKLDGGIQALASGDERKIRQGHEFELLLKELPWLVLKETDKYEGVLYQVDWRATKKQRNAYYGK